MTLLQFLGGLLLLVGGAELFVRSASRVAAWLGIPPVVVGLTVVAFGTSAPELAVTVSAALDGHDDLAFATVVGSNSFNILLILGLSALVAPLVVVQRLVRLDVPLMILVSGGLAVLALDGRIGRVEGAAMFALLLAWTAYTVRAARRSRPEVVAEYAQARPAPGAAARGSLLRVVGGLALGLACLVFGAEYLVEAAASLGRALGLAERVVGVTIVSAGTSLPELATSVVAALRGQRDIAVGNVVGSNLFNVLSVLGLSAAVAPEGLAVSSAALRFDVPVMLAASLACLPILFTGHRISRAEGLLLLAGYGAYVTVLVGRG
jgi:cation:H+ antiporter